MSQTAIKPMTIVGREAEANTISYYIQSGAENVYIAQIKNGAATTCHLLSGEECKGFHYGHKCRHTTLAIQNEKERSTDQHIHVQDEQHTCISCWRRVKHANMLCYACITGEY